MTARVAILIGGKGRGSNMRRLIEACRAGEVPGTAALVIAPPGKEVDTLDVPIEHLDPTHDHYGEDLAATLQAYNVTHLCLAGYLRLLPLNVLRLLPDRILNIHPALLPKHGGKGMYGLHVHRAVLAASDTETGCTVHLVNERYDEGRILLQLKCPVEPGDTPESLAARVLIQEHNAYPLALAQLIRHEA